MRESVRKMRTGLAALFCVTLLMLTVAGCSLFKPWDRLDHALDAGDYERAGELYDRHFAANDEDAAAAEDRLAASILRLESAAFKGTKPLLEVIKEIEALSPDDYSTGQTLSREALTSLWELAQSQQLSQEASASAGQGDLRGALLTYQDAGDWPVFAADAAWLHDETAASYVTAIDEQLRELVSNEEHDQAMALVDDALAVLPEDPSLLVWQASLEDATRARAGEQLSGRINDLTAAASYDAAWDELDLAAPDLQSMVPVISARGRLAHTELNSLYGQLDTLEAEANLQEALALTEAAMARYPDEVALQARLINYRTLVESGGAVLRPETTGE